MARNCHPPTTMAQPSKASLESAETVIESPLLANFFFHPAQTDRQTVDKTKEDSYLMGKKSS